MSSPNRAWAIAFVANTRRDGAALALRGSCLYTSTMATRNWQHERSVAVRPGLAGKRGSTAEMVRGYIFMSRSFVASSTLPKRH